MQSDEVLVVEMRRTESNTAMSSEVGRCNHVGNNISGKEQSRTAGGATAQREEVITVLLVTLVSSVWSLAATSKWAIGSLSSSLSHTLTHLHLLTHLLTYFPTYLKYSAVVTYTLTHSLTHSLISNYTALLSNCITLIPLICGLYIYIFSSNSGVCWNHWVQ